MKQSIPPGVAVGIVIAIVVVAVALIWKGSVPEKSDKPFDMKKAMGAGAAPPAGAGGSPASPGR